MIFNNTAVKTNIMMCDIEMFLIIQKIKISIYFLIWVYIIICIVFYLKNNKKLM